MRKLSFFLEKIVKEDTYQEAIFKFENPLNYYQNNIKDSWLKLLTQGFNFSYNLVANNVFSRMLYDVYKKYLCEL